MSIIWNDFPTKDLHKTLKGKYRKRYVTLCIREEGPVKVEYDPHWSGGTREYQKFYAMIGKYPNHWVEISREQAGVTTVRKREDGTEIIGLAGPLTTTTLNEGVICVTTGYFCGKTATMRIDCDRDTFMWTDNS